eukprot:246692-Amphidinium_carterae.1
MCGIVLKLFHVAVCFVGGLLSFTLGGKETPVPHLETALCEELKSWLLASSTLPAAEVAQRLDFYDGLLMRPELFDEVSFS